MDRPRIPLGHVNQVLRAVSGQEVPGAIHRKDKQPISDTDEQKLKAAMKRARKQARVAALLPVSSEVAGESMTAWLDAAVDPDDSPVVTDVPEDSPTLSNETTFKRAQARRERSGKAWRDGPI